MVRDNGKSCNHNISELEKNVKAACSVLAASANSLAQSVHSPLSSNEIPRNTVDVLTGLDKAQSSNGSSSSNSCLSSNNRNEIPPKLFHSYRFDGLRLNHNEQQIHDPNKEYCNFLNVSNSLVHSELSSYKISSRNNMVLDSSKTNETISSSVGEQEYRDGEDVINLLSNIEESEYGQEVSEDTNIFDSSFFCSRIDHTRPFFKAKSAVPIRPSVKFLEQDTFDFLPIFDNLETNQYQWMEIQENYTEKIWGAYLETVKESKVVGLKSSLIELNPLQNTATRRLEAIWRHVRE